MLSSSYMTAWECMKEEGNDPRDIARSLKRDEMTQSEAYDILTRYGIDMPWWKKGISNEQVASRIFRHVCGI